LDFDGEDDYLALGEGDQLLGTTDAFTVATWVYRHSDDPGPAGAQVILDAESSSSDNPGLNAGFRLVLRDGAPEVFYGVDSTTEDFSQFTATDTEIPTDTWTHVAASLESSTVRVFVNGAVVLEVLDAPGGPISYNGRDYETDVYHVGRYVTGAHVAPEHFYRGGLQNLAVWNRALTSAEIETERTMPGAVTDGRVAWWSLTEGEGTVSANADDPMVDADLMPVESPPTWVADCPAP